MEVDFSGRDTKISPFLDKAVKERTAWEPGTTDIPTVPRVIWVEPAVCSAQNKDGAELWEKAYRPEQIVAGKTAKRFISILVLNRYCLIWVISILFYDDDLFAEELEKSPKRPHLVSINTVVDIYYAVFE